MTPTTAPDPRLKLIYEMAEQRYLRSLPPEHFMETTPQATQRAITLASFALVHAQRPDVQCFNELLVQYPRENNPDRPGQVVPDNMVVVHPEPIVADGSFNLPLQPVGPFLVLEYVSKSSARKDYDGNMLKYEHVRVPHYLLFYPDNDELSLFRLVNGRYASVLPNPAGRLAIPELELEVALLNGWARYWFRGEMETYERNYWVNRTAVGQFFYFGVLLAVTVGAIFIYQMMVADIKKHLPEYATLKAMGYRFGFLFRVVVWQAVFLAVAGYAIGLVASFALYEVAKAAAGLPIWMTFERTVIVLALTVGMCVASGVLAVRKVRNADPADLF